MRYLLCPDCGRPFAQIIDGCLVVKAQHRGVQHVCTISVVELLLQAHLDQAEQLEEHRRRLADLKVAEETKMAIRRGKAENA